MENLGWNEGQGLGRNEEGLLKCVQIKRREEGAAVGAENDTPAGTFRWGDSFWDEAYNKAAKNFAAAEVKSSASLKRDLGGDSSSSDESEFELQILRSKSRIF